MSIEFTEIAGERVNFTAPNTVGLSLLSVVAWVDLDTLAAPSANDYIFSLDANNVNVDDGWSLYTANNTGRIIFSDGGTVGFWERTVGITTGVHHIIVTIDRTSTSNDPLFYLDGFVGTTSELVAPSRGVVGGSNSIISAGAFDSGQLPIDGKLHSVMVYNRILTAAECLEAYNSRLAIPSYNGLVFAPNLSGAATAQIFDGTTLTSSHKIVDLISGAIGTPTGSLIGRADDLLTYE